MVDINKANDEFREIGLNPDQIAWGKLKLPDGSNFAIATIPTMAGSPAVINLMFTFSPNSKNSPSAISTMEVKVLKNKLSWINAGLMKYGLTQPKNVLMSQIFFRDSGPLPSIQNLQKRALDYINPPAIPTIVHTDPDKKLRADFQALNFNYDDFTFKPIGIYGDCILASNIVSLKHISGKDDNLRFQFTLKKADDNNSYHIHSVTSDLQRLMENGPITLMKEYHLNNLHTLPKMEHLYARATEILSILKVRETFSLDQQHNPRQQNSDQMKQRGIGR